MSYKRYSYTDQGFIYDGPVPYRQTQTPLQLIEARRTATLNDRNPYGWPQSPATVFGTFSTPGWWFEFLNYDPWVYNSTDGTPMNCWLSLDDGGDCDAQECAGIVYDALGGAKYAYMVGWEKWQIWEALTDDLSSVNKSCPTSDCYETDYCNSGQQRIGGPSSCLGMPVTNSYEVSQGSNVWRQDFQKGYIQNGTIHCYPSCAPGWASGETWNSRYSYLFADAYDRNGAVRDVGNAQNRVHVLAGNILIQDFDGGNDAAGMIMYDQENWDGNACATNKAYWVYGTIKDRYDAGRNGMTGVESFGCATIDRFYYGGVWCQDFKKGDQFCRIYATGEPAWLPIDPCTEDGDYQISGGLDNTGFADLAVLYDYQYDSSVFHTFLSTGDVLNYQGNNGWWGSGSYDAEAVVGSASGDFDGDGYSDVANVYWYGGTTTRIHVFLSDGSTYVLSNGSNGWWSSTGYNGSCVVGVAAKDFNEDGKDDLAVMYWYGGTTTRIHVFLSTGSSFTYQGDNGWWASTGYNGGCVVGFVSGFFNTDDKGDLAAMYWYGGTTTRIHVWLSTGSSLTLSNGSNGWWSSTGYNGGCVVGFAGGDFNADGKDDVAAMYHYGGTTTRVHMFLSTGSAFSLSGGSDGWWAGTDYDGSCVVGFAAGDASGDGRADAIAAYGYTETQTRFHVFRSTGTELVLDNGDDGWWSSTAYAPGRINAFVCGYFNPNTEAAGKAIADEGGSLPSIFTLQQNYPNPFNATTVISYTLPEATHVRLNVYNILGQRVATLVDAQQNAGQHDISWVADQYSSGIYFYRLQTREATETKKMLLLK